MTNLTQDKEKKHHTKNSNC